MYMTKKKKMKKGFNLIETYPVKFSETIIFVKHNGPVDSFNFAFPDKKVEHIIVNLCPTEPWALPNRAILRNRTHNFLNKLETVRAEYFAGSHCHVVVNHHETSLVNELNQYKSNADKIPLPRTKSAEDFPRTKSAEDFPRTKNAEDFPRTKNAEDFPRTKSAEDFNPLLPRMKIGGGKII